MLVSLLFKALKTTPLSSWLYTTHTAFFSSCMAATEAQPVVHHGNVMLQFMMYLHTLFISEVQNSPPRWGKMANNIFEYFIVLINNHKVMPWITRVKMEMVITGTI